MNRTIFYVWTSTRDFPRKEFVEVFDFDSKTKHAVLNGSISLPVCFACAEELGYNISD